jgi:hypothetical protein
MNLKSFVVTGVTMTGLVASAVLAIGTPAGAAPSAPQAPSGQERQTGMYVAGFDAKVAKANGYKIVTYANGDLQSVPADPQSKLRKGPILHPQSLPHRPVTSLTAPVSVPDQQPTTAAAANTDYNSVTGNCGVSWIRVTQTGTNKVAIASGYRNLPWSAYFWTWDVQLADRNGTSHQRHSGPTAGTAASRTWQNLNQYGYTYDYVYAGGATLVNGTICLSGRPDVYIAL